MSAPILLNHGSHQQQLAEGFQLPPTITVSPLGRASGGEGDPWSIRMKRDAWQLKRPGKCRENKRGSRLWIEYLQRELRVKSSGPDAGLALLKAIHPPPGCWAITSGTRRWESFIDDAGIATAPSST